MTHEQSFHAADFTGGFRRDAQSPEQQAPPLQHAQMSLVMANFEGLRHLKRSTLPKISKQSSNIISDHALAIILHPQKSAISPFMRPLGNIKVTYGYLENVSRKQGSAWTGSLVTRWYRDC